MNAFGTLAATASGVKHCEAARVAITPESGTGSVRGGSAEAEAVRAFLPTQPVAELIAAQVAALRRIRRVADREVRAAENDGRESQAEAARAAIGRCWEEVAIVPVLIAEAELIDESCCEAARPAEQGLVGPVGVAQPIRDGLSSAVGADATVAVVRVAGEELVSSY